MLCNQIFILREFGKERERVENRQAFLLLRQGQQTDRALAGYIDWIDAAEQVLVKEEDEETGQSRTVFFSQLFCLEFCKK